MESNLKLYAEIDVDQVPGLWFKENWLEKFKSPIIKIINSLEYIAESPLDKSNRIEVGRKQKCGDQYHFFVVSDGVVVVYLSESGFITDNYPNYETKWELIKTNTRKI